MNHPTEEQSCFYRLFFFFNDTATTEIYTLSLHDALPISCGKPKTRCCSRRGPRRGSRQDRKSTRLNSSHGSISYAVFCLKKKKNKHQLAETVSEFFFTLSHHSSETAH